MSGSLRALRWRTAVMVVGAAFVLAWLYFSTGGGAYVIQVDYTWGGEFLDSAQVMIGDSVLGFLLPRAGGQRISGFEVEPGEYEVRVEKESCEGIPKTVALRDGESRRAVLMADIDDGYNCRIRLW